MIKVNYMVCIIYKHTDLFGFLIIEKYAIFNLVLLHVTLYPTDEKTCLIVLVKLSPLLG